MAAELGQQTVEFSVLVRRAANESFLALKELIDRSKSTDQRESDKKIELLKYVAKTRQRMLRLHVLAKWCQQVPLVQYCQQLASTLSSHDTCFTQAADSLFFMHEVLQQARAPIYDVPSAIEILLTSSYERLPKYIEDLGLHSTLSEKEQKPALKKLDSVIRSKLLELTLPKEISEVKVSNGTLQVQVNGEFKVVLTLGYRGHLSLWRILHIELLVGEKNGTVKLEETRRYVLGDDLERRMAVAENPFTTLYSILHELCVALVMDTVIRQAQVLRVSRWKDAIRLDLVTESSSGGGNVNHLQYTQDSEPELGSLKTPGLKISYWLDFHKGAGGSDHGSSPYLKIEPGSDLVIKCLHSTFVLDPFSNTEAEFSLVQQCIDVEKLLLRTIACNKHTRLLEIYRELCNNTQICRTPSDVILQRQKGATETDKEKEGHLFGSDDHYEDEVLRVRAYGSMYITLGISIRSGRFILQCSKNIFELSVLADREEALNQGTLTAAEVFMNLRSKSILHLFASTGSFLGLQVYEQGLPTLRIPKGILNGPNCLLMGFPQCGPSYFLVMQLDKNFKPLFKLLETQPGPGEVATSVENDHVVRCNNIDISNMELIEDELNLSLLNWDKLYLSSPGEDTAALSSEQNILHAHDSTFETALQRSSHPNSSFSSIVDEVFDFEKGLSASALPIQNKLSSFDSPLQSQTVSIQGVKSGRSPNMWGRELSYSGSAKPSGGLAIHNSSYRQDDSKSSFYTGSLASSSPFRGSSSAQDLARSKSEQDLSSGRSPVMSPPQVSGSRIPVANTKQSGPKMTTSNQIASYLESVPTVSKTAAVCKISGRNDVAKQYKNSGKRCISEVLPLIPSLLGSNNGTRKKRKIVSSAHCYPITLDKSTSLRTHHVTRYTYGSLLANANQVDPNVYLSSLLHVVRHCSLCIKHARLTSQMDSLEIPYVEEVGQHSPSSNLWFRLPFTKDDSWHRICLHLGKPGSMCWDVRLNDSYFKELWELQKGSANTMWSCGVRIANSSDIDSHIRYHPDGVVLSYKTVESDSIQKLVSDLQRLFNARLFACGMRKLLAVKADKTLPDGASNDENKIENATKVIGEPSSKLLESIQRPFKIEAVGLMSLWFCYGTMPVTAHFVVEWEAGKEGCTMHVSPDQLWPHTKFLEDFINGGEVASFLDCVRLTAGPLISLGNAVRPARVPIPVASMPPPVAKQNGGVQSLSVLPNTSSSNTSQPASTSVVGGPLASHSLHGAAVLSAAGRGGPGIVPSSLLPIDVSVVLRGPYWIRIIYRKKFSVDMRCFAGDQVWLQPATPPKDGPAIGGSLPCPQFRPFIMEHVAQGLNSLENSFTSGMHAGGSLGSNSASSNLNSAPVVPNGGRATSANVSAPRPPAAVGTQGAGGLTRIGNSMLASSGLGTMSSGLPPIRISPGAGVPVHVKGELNTAFVGLGDDGGYGGGWVPLAALKKVLRGILKYLGVLWLFAQLPELLKDILGSILKDNEGTLLNLDQEQPALRFFVGTYVFAVSVHRVQLLLQVLSVKRFHHHQQQPQQQQPQSNSQEEFTSTEINEMCDYFSRRVASEPYDTSRVASFITLLTLPISVLRDFLKLIAWEKVLSQGQGGDAASSQRPRVELCLEKHSGTLLGENAENPSIAKSNIRHDRPHSSVEFALTFVLDSSLIPHVNAAGGAAWLPYCVSVRLKYSFGENPHLSLVGIDGSHGGKACWPRLEDWDKCKQRIARAVDYGNGNSSGDTSQGRLRFAAETMQRSLQGSLQQIRDTSAAPVTATT